jgi:endoglucanase
VISDMINTPQAVWFNGGTAKQVQKDVAKTMKEAAGQHAVPTLVAYNVPFRDCGQYSAGGALNTADYLAWIDGFAKGAGN